MSADHAVRCSILMYFPTVLALGQSQTLDHSFTRFLSVHLPILFSLYHDTVLGISSRAEMNRVMLQTKDA